MSRTMLLCTCKFQQSFFSRQLVAGGLLDVLRNAKDLQERKIVFDALNKLAQDEGV